VVLKKFIAILLLNVYVLTATEFHQLFKLSFLIEHYLEHKEHNQDLSLLNFLDNHYANQHAEDEAHHQLPFKSADHCMGNTLAIVFCQHPFQTSFHTYPVDITAITFEQEQFISSAYLSAIWQPPKAC
jgi:hypothetical protein